MIDFTLFDAESEMDMLVEKFEEASGEVLYEGDERETLLKCMLYIMETLMNEINAQANNTLALFCDEAHLIYMGAQQNTYRLPAEPAKVTVRFTISDQALADVTIPAGTRVTADGVTFFAVQADTDIAPDSYDDLVCVATEPGAQGNGYTTGQINVLVDVIPYVESVTNTDTSAGGADQQSLENFREDVQYAPLKYNTAGSEGGYIYKTKSVSASIADVAVTASGANVSVYVLCQNGALPSADLLTAVKAYLDQKNIKPVTNNITTYSAVRKNYTVDISYKISPADYTEAAAIQARVAQAVDDYIAALGSKMGTDINPEMFKKVCYDAGAATVTVTYPSAYTTVAKYEVPYCTSKTVTYAGILS